MSTADLTRGTGKNPVLPLPLDTPNNTARASTQKGRRATRPWFDFIDLFAGIGGFRAGFESIGGRCVFTSEWDDYAQRTYRANFPVTHPIAGDIRAVRSEDIPDFHVLLAGFPCQPFSIAGVSKKNALGRPHGFACEAQGTLFFDVARIIRDCRPEAFVLENVKNLIRHDKGNTFRVIQQVLTEELGYTIQCRIIDAQHFVPQHRERIFVVGFRENVGFDFEQLVLPSLDNAPTLGGILHPQDGSEHAEAPFTEGPKAKVADKYVLTDALWTYLQRYAEKHQAKGNGFGFGLVRKSSVTRTLSARYYKDGSEILVARGSGNPRRLTPRECARLMGFDEPNGADFVIPVSDTRAYKQFGNSVAVPVVRAVAKAMKPQLHRVVERPFEDEQYPLALSAS